MAETITMQELVTNYGTECVDHALVSLTPGAPVWQIRERVRMQAGWYTTIFIQGDDPMRFLHVSTDAVGKVAYTKSAEKGEQDIQTRTTLEKYCEKFGLPMPAPAPVTAYVAVAASTWEAVPESTPRRDWEVQDPDDYIALHKAVDAVLTANKALEAAKQVLFDMVDKIRD